MDRVRRVQSQLQPTSGSVSKADARAKESLTVKDNRTGKSYELPITQGTIKAKDLSAIKLPDADVGIRSYDPGYTNTALGSSRITWIDGPKGILRYRGYAIEELAEKSSFLEVAFLVLYGELPTTAQLDYFADRVNKHSFIHKDLADIMSSFRYDAHPMGMLCTTLAAQGTLHPEANPALAGQDVYDDKALRNKQIHRIIGNMKTIAAFAYRHRMGRPFVYPSHNKMSYTESFLYMIDQMSNKDYKPNRELAKALNVLFILHVDHEFNASTSAVRHLTSAGVDVYTALSAGIGALYGPRHGGANEAVLRMLEKIGDKKNIPEFIEKVKRREVKLMGFGHRVYKNYDPRARVVRGIAETVFNIVGREPLIEVAEALEKAALSDPFFIKRKLYPNVDFYSGIIYKALGFPTDFFPVLFAIPRSVGWLAHWNEFLDDPENRIVRPRQVYRGEGKDTARDYVPATQRYFNGLNDSGLNSNMSAESKRRYQGQFPNTTNP